jgi:hypothetical protein
MAEKIAMCEAVQTSNGDVRMETRYTHDDTYLTDFDTLKNSPTRKQE